MGVVLFGNRVSTARRRAETSRSSSSLGFVEVALASNAANGEDLLGLGAESPSSPVHFVLTQHRFARYLPYDGRAVLAHFGVGESSSHAAFAHL